MPFDNPEAEVTLNDVTLRLIAGRQRIENGWVQNDFEENGSYCALGAIGFRDSYQYDQDRHTIMFDCVKFLQKSLPPGALVTISLLFQITIYNDDPNRAQSEIIDLFDRAIANSMNCV